MNATKIGSFLGLLLASSIATAGGFDGPFVQIGVGGAESDTKFNQTRNERHQNSLATQSDSQNSTIGQIAAGYSQSFGGFNLAASVFYMIGDQSAGSTNFADQSGRGRDRENNTWSVRAQNADTFGVSIEPGWNLSENALIYAKLSYTETRGSVEVDQITTKEGRNHVHVTTSSNSGNATYRGWGYGLGAKYKFASNLYGVVEVMQSDFGDSSYELPQQGKDHHKNAEKYEMDRTSLSAFVGIGYKF